jgi:hypothetical protein
MLQILGGIALLLLFLLCVPLGLRLSYEKGELSLTLGYLFLRVRLLPAKAPGRAAKPAKPKKKAKPRGRPPDGEKPGEKKRAPGELLDILLDLLRSTGGAWNILRRHVVFHRVRLYFLISGEDAHKTALAYARYSAAVFSVLSLLSAIFVLKDRTVFLSPDFTGTKSRYDLSLRVRIRPVFAVAAAASLLWHFLKGRIRRPTKSKGGRNHEPTASRQ